MRRDTTVYTKHLRTILAVVGLALAVGTVRAQEPTTPDTADHAGPYTVNASVETGVRGVKIEGDEDSYRSDLNYQPGFQFIDSSLLLRAAPHEAPVFDTLLVKVTGWDSDPSGYLRVDAEKLDWYRFNGTVRRFEYFNALNQLALGQHRDNTVHKLGDFNVVLFPQHRPFRANFEYAFDKLDGPTTSTY